MNTGDVFTLRILRQVKPEGEQVGPYKIPGNRNGTLFVAAFDQMKDREFVIESDEYPMIPKASWKDA